MNDSALIRARVGDDQAFAALTDPYRRELQLHCYRIRRDWSGLLDISPDGLPIIDRINRVVFVTGLSGHGLALGPVIGEITADLALDGATARPIHPFRLARFREQQIQLPNKMI